MVFIVMWKTAFTIRTAANAPQAGYRCAALVPTRTAVTKLSARPSRHATAVTELCRPIRAVHILFYIQRSEYEVFHFVLCDDLREPYVLIGMPEALPSSSTRVNSSLPLSLPSALSTEPLNLYGLAVEAITVLVLSPVAFTYSS